MDLEEDWRIGGLKPMARQYKREPLTSEETDSLMNACTEGKEKLLVWGLLETGLRIEEFLSLRKEQIDWQAKRVRIVGKIKKRRVVPLTDRAVSLLGSHFALSEGIGIKYGLFCLNPPWLLSKLVQANSN